VAIVQNQPITVELGRDNGVVLFAVVVAQDNNAKVVGGNPSLLQGNKFCDRVIFAVTGTTAKVASGGLQTSSSP